MITTILQYNFKRPLHVYNYLKLHNFIFTYSFTINIHLHAYKFPNYRIKDVIMYIIAWMKHKNIYLKLFLCLFDLYPLGKGRKG